MTNLVNHNGGSSPFDKIRQIRADGSEFWSGRDMQEPLGYDQWRRFVDAIDRAKAACQNSGNDPADHFAGVGKMVPIGSGATREATDYHMSRYGCYLVAMNGDPRKPEVATAQAYFAIKTREAELGDQARSLPKDYKTALRELLARVEETEALQSKVKALEPKARFFDSVGSAINSLTIAEVAKAFGWGEKRFFAWLRENQYLITGGTGHNLPYQRWIESGYFTLVEKTYKHRKSGEDVLYSQTLISGKGICYFHRKLTEEGIILPPLEDISDADAA